VDSTLPDPGTEGANSAIRTLVFDCLDEAVVLVSPDGQIIDLNGAAIAFFGWRRGEIVGTSVTRLTPPGHEPKLTNALVYAYRKSRWRGEIDYRCKDGRTGVADLSTAPMRDDADENLGAMVIFRDISVRKVVESELELERQNLRLVFDALPDPVLFKDTAGHYLLYNEACRRLLNLDDLNYLGKTVFEMPIDREEAERFADDDRKVMEGGLPVINREESIQPPGQEPRRYLTSKFPIHDGKGAVNGLISISRDVTERAEALRKLADERRMLRTVIDAVRDPIFLKDRDGRLVMQNEAFMYLFNWEDLPLTGCTVWDIPALREHAARFEEDDRAVLTTGEPMINREELHTLEGGRKGWFLTSKFPLRGADGEIIGLVGIARDITQLKQAAIDLEKARHRISDHMKNTPLAVIEWQPDFRCQCWLGQAEAIFGWSAREVIGKRFHELKFVHPEDVARVVEGATRLKEGKEKQNVILNRNVTKSGAIVQCFWYNSALHDSDGNVVSMLSFVQDVTEHVLAQERIREYERLYHTIIDATNTGYVILDRQGQVIHANEEYIALTGHASVEKIVGRKVTEWTAPHDVERLASAVENCITGGGMKNLEIDYVTPEGQIVPVEINGKTRKSGGGDKVKIVAFCRDISARRRAEAERNEIERRLQESQKLESLGVLAGGIAHDFNNLLTGVLGSASLAAMELPEGPTLRRHIEQIEVAAVRAADLCKQLLAYSGRGRFLIQRADLNSVVQETTDLLRLSISKKAQLRFVLAPQLPPVMADTTQMRQIVMNLVINASEALGDQTGEITVSTGVVDATREILDESSSSGGLPEGPYVTMEVRDTGCGMTPEVRSRIFDPFFTTKFTGRGLGLAAVLGIVRGHKGALRVQSEAGQGTSFQVLFPAVEGISETPAEVPVEAAEWTGKGRVLVADDEEAVRMTAAMMLEYLGFQVLQASDGDAAVKALSTAASDGGVVLVLLDLMMPRMDGRETFAEVMRLHPGVPVLMMSGYDEEEALSKFDGVEPAGFIEKPFRFETFRTKIRQALGG